MGDTVRVPEANMPRIECGHWGANDFLRAAGLEPVPELEDQVVFVSSVDRDACTATLSKARRNYGYRYVHRWTDADERQLAMLRAIR